LSPRQKTTNQKQTNHNTMNSQKYKSSCTHQQAAGSQSFLRHTLKPCSHVLPVVILTTLAFCFSARLAVGQIITSNIISSRATYVSSAAVDTNYGGANPFELSSGGATRQGMVSWDLSALPVDAVITNATITLFGNFVVSLPAPGTGSVLMYQTTSAWSENTVTWNTRPTFGTLSLGSSAVTNGAPAPYVFTSANLLSLVQGWHDGTIDNYGVYLFANTTNGFLAGTIGINSDDAIDTSLRPLLEVSYVPEPSTYALLAMSGLALAGYVIRRRRRA